MKLKFTKQRVYASLLILSLFVACGGELPIQDMNDAKKQIGRAESLKAGEYAPEEMEEAKKSLFQAHEDASNENASEAKKSANYAISKAYDALEKSLPKLSAKARDEATEAIDKADEAFATGLAATEFDNAVALRKEGDQNMEKGDQVLSEFLLERDESKKGSLRQSAFNHYETSYNNYLDSKKAADTAHSLALSSKDELRQSARYVEEDLNTAETYLGGPTEKTRKERESIASAYQDIDNDELKKANEKIQAARSNSRTLLANSIQNYARERLQTATEVVEDGNSKFDKISEEEISKDPAMKKNFDSARENLGAANEALASSGNLYAQEKFEDSIKQSEEAIRLGDIAIEQSAMMSPDALAAMKSRSSASADDESSKTGDKGKGNLKEGWSKYTVQRAKPEDCLWRIAKRKEYYGNAKLWPRIYKANKSQIKNKNLIYPNQVLYIPPKSGPIGSPYKSSDESGKPAISNQERLNLKEDTEDKKEGETNKANIVPPGSSVNGPETSEDDMDSKKTQGNEEEMLNDSDFVEPEFDSDDED
ncbi:MAG: LysM peptidoglycan-binding domain-containing protein [Leptospira sp.]|nr:LysM peptidoglycan-binding domain-containing protein [Leptospira sp.]